MTRTPAIVRFAALLAFAPPVSAQHVCDAAAEPGWRVVASTEVAAVRDSAPLRSPSGEWFVERTTMLLPMCTYFDATGAYSLRTYSLDPFERAEPVIVCHAAAPVAPYNGPCPP